MIRRIIPLIIIFLLFFTTGCEAILPNNIEVENDIVEEKDRSPLEQDIVEGENYYDVEEVAEYIHLYKKLPPNYITKSEANKIGWSVKDRKELVIGGDEFGNREGILPDKEGRQYYEADISAGYTTHRGPLRLVYSNDGLIFYTEDHYKNYLQLY
ncbi:MAG: hypothetical protein GX666_08485 [Tissierellia bacterium]|nr:hypothetical protein [Tissierellia bacterium]